ncbi:MAG TPA: calcium/proton exchanger [Gemmatimonadales bacterium]|nr:calcium/proton exchanger [Gemmatimonadales bacterium]
MSSAGQDLLSRAAAEAARLGSGAVGAEHLLLAALDDAPVAAAVEASGASTAQLRTTLEAGARRARARRAAASNGQLPLTSHARRLLDAAARSAGTPGVITAPELAAAAARDPGSVLTRVLGGAEPSSGFVAALEGGAADQRPAVARKGSGLPPHLDPGRTPVLGPPWRRVLLLAAPVAVVLALLHQTPVLVFLLACVGVLPLAAMMGDATEHLAARTGPTLGGLLNATFGNAAELIIGIVALRAGLVTLVKASITGSIIGNLLLILGLALVVGGARRSELRFNRVAAGMSATMLTLAVIGLVFPALFHATHIGPLSPTELLMSEGVALVLAITYGFSLLFSLKTHRQLFCATAHDMTAPIWGRGKAIAVLAGATAGVAVLSEILVHATEAVTARLGLTETFLGLIVIPIIGNAAEHATAVVMAGKGKMDLALQVALGSSTQIALLVAPALVLAGVLLGQRMDLVFSPFEVVALGLATAIAALSMQDGESHWFEGVQLLAVYTLTGLAAYFI